jgi:hypothetical protein
MKLSHHRDREATESIFCFSLLLRREQRKRDMPFGRVLSFKELTRSAGAFPFLPSLQKREDESASVSSEPLAKPPQIPMGDKRVVREQSELTRPKGRSAYVRSEIESGGRREHLSVMIRSDVDGGSGILP